jgi:hypothetical protein
MLVMRALVSALVAFVVLFFVTTMISIFSSLSDEISATISLPFSILVGWAVWKITHGRQVGAGFAVLSGALIFGGLGLSIGLIGPMLFARDANQGPMLGIFITGPLGFVIGAVSGYVYWSSKRRSEGEENST